MIKLTYDAWKEGWVSRELTQHLVEYALAHINSDLEPCGPIGTPVQLPMLSELEKSDFPNAHPVIKELVAQLTQYFRAILAEASERVYLLIPIPNGVGRKQEITWRVLNDARTCGVVPCVTPGGKTCGTS